MIPRLNKRLSFAYNSLSLMNPESPLHYSLSRTALQEDRWMLKVKNLSYIRQSSESILTNAGGVAPSKWGNLNSLMSRSSHIVSLKKIRSRLPEVPSIKMPFRNLGDPELLLNAATTARSDPPRPSFAEMFWVPSYRMAAEKPHVSIAGTLLEESGNLTEPWYHFGVE